MGNDICQKGPVTVDKQHVLRNRLQARLCVIKLMLRKVVVFSHKFDHFIKTRRLWNTD